MASKGTQRPKPAKKVKYFDRFNRLLDTYSTLIVVCADNVLSGQMHQVRIALRGKAEIIMGKNTLMRRIIRSRNDQHASPANQSLYDAFIGEDILRGNVGLVMTNEDVKSICEVLGRFKVESPARAGALAPVEVVIPAGPTGLEPTQTAFFMALNIGTKIEKGQVSIMKDVTVCRPNEKVGSSEAKLLAKLKLRPFKYGLEPLYYLKGGAVFPASMMNMDTSSMLESVQLAVDEIAALSLAVGVITTPALAHSVFDAFKDVLAIALQTDTSFPDFGAATLLKNVKEGKVSAAPAAAAPAAAAKSAAAKPEPKAAAAAAPAPAEKAEEEENTDFGVDLF